MEHLKRELSELSEQMARQNKLAAMLNSLRQEEQALLQKESQLYAALIKEDADVQRLEKTSVTSILYTLLGKKEEALEKEQRESFSAKLKYDAAVCQLEDCQGRIEALSREAQMLSGCESRYREVFAAVQQLLHNDPQYAEQLCALEHNLGETCSQLREVSEAISAGNACMRQIQSIEDSLDSAEGWGTWDILGGGIISDLAKHSHLDEAQSGAEQLQSLLSRFRTELADVQINAQLGQVNVDGFLLFADYFFDGLIADWCVLSHIQESQQGVYQIKGQVADVLSKLTSIQAALQQQKAGLEQQLEEFVQQA